MTLFWYYMGLMFVGMVACHIIVTCACKRIEREYNDTQSQ